MYKLDYLSILFSIVVVNLLLSGDNALVIALASRRLPKRQQKAAILWGGAGAIGLRILLTLAAVSLLTMPYLLLVGGLLLFWVAVKLAVNDHQAEEEVKAAGNLWEAVRTILLADLVMSVDNVVAIAGVARGNIFMLVIGLLLSIPIIIWGSRLITALMQRWPLIITAGAAFLGWTAGEMVVAEGKLASYIGEYPPAQWGIPAAFAAAVIAAEILKSRSRMKQRE
ncbi:MAG: TerC family protein [Negativicutes bacterium]|nr:TerC family protein [Negativicutes bacterium]